jgi:hypothetical protein
MNLRHPQRLILCIVSAAILGGCAIGGVGISIPIGPFASVGLGINAAGQVSANVGVGGSVGHVGISGGTSFPIGSIASEPVPASPASHPQTGGSQNVPR